MAGPQKTTSFSFEQVNRRREARLEIGRSARKRLSRGRLADLPPDESRDPMGVFRRAQRDRVEKLLPIKYARMATSAFAFFRGAVSIMAADLAGQPNTGLMVQLCGDAHLQNLGSFETPDGRVAFDINDFDETVPGPWEWDVKRMATSIALAGVDAGHNASDCRKSVEAFLETYCLAIEEAAKCPVLVMARRQIHRLQDSAAVQAAFEQSRRATPLELRDKYTEKNGRGKLVFKENGKTLWRVRGEKRSAVLKGVEAYLQTLAPDRLHLFRFFTPLDVAFKVVGTGSVGLRDYVLLMEGNGPEDPLFLQIKQEVAPAYQAFAHFPKPAHEGQRVAEGQRKIQPISDLLLGWTTIDGHHYLVRQMNDHKGSIDLENLRGPGLRDLAVVAGHLLARGHARSGDAVSISAYIGVPDKVVKALAGFAMNYAELTAKDYKMFLKNVQAKTTAAAS